jgi:hypothetical protein
MLATHGLWHAAVPEFSRELDLRSSFDCVGAYSYRPQAWKLVVVYLKFCLQC